MIKIKCIIKTESSYKDGCFWSPKLTPKIISYVNRKNDVNKRFHACFFKIKMKIIGILKQRMVMKRVVFGAQN